MISTLFFQHCWLVNERNSNAISIHAEKRRIQNEKSHTPPSLRLIAWKAFGKSLSASKPQRDGLKIHCGIRPCRWFTRVPCNANERRGKSRSLSCRTSALASQTTKPSLLMNQTVHLHPSLMGRLWRALETARPDCFFIFVTHDIQFASAHGTSDKVWVKSHDGEKWCWEFIPESDLPEQLLLELLGNRKNVLLLKGVKTASTYNFIRRFILSIILFPAAGAAKYRKHQSFCFDQ